MLKNYASYFVSYLLNNIKNENNVERIVLYGSVAKGESTKDSDIDIFIEVKKETKNFEREIKKIEENFYQSRENALFKSKGKQYEGLLSKFKGNRIGKSCIILPIQYKKDILTLLEKHKVKARILDVFH